MRKQFVPFIGASLALLLVACSRPDSETVSEPEPAAAEAPAAESMRGPDSGEAGGADPTVVDPERYTAEFENDAVRILRINYGPGEESPMHYHPDSVAVFLTDIDVTLTMSDESAQEVSSPAGTAIFSAAGEHSGKNTSDSAWEVVEIELKPRDPSTGEAGGPDATVVDAGHYSTEFENDIVRVVRIAYGPGEASVMHHHPDSVAVFLTDHLVEMTMPDGSTGEISANAGDVLFIEGGQHLPKNISDSAWELVLVELK